MIEQPSPNRFKEFPPVLCKGCKGAMPSAAIANGYLHCTEECYLAHFADELDEDGIVNDDESESE
jgi:hypothetical protein